MNHLYSTTVTECEVKGDESDLNWVQYKNKCYYASPNIPSQWQSWHSADTFCKDFGGFLVSIHSLNENRFLTSKVIK